MQCNANEITFSSVFTMSPCKLGRVCSCRYAADTSAARLGRRLGVFESKTFIIDVLNIATDPPNCGDPCSQRSVPQAGKLLLLVSIAAPARPPDIRILSSFFDFDIILLRSLVAPPRRIAPLSYVTNNAVQERSSRIDSKVFSIYTSERLQFKNVGCRKKDIQHRKTSM